MQYLEELLSRYERGQVGRREFLSALAAMTPLAATGQPPSGFAARHLTHVSIRVRDVRESEKFYRELFGLPPMHDAVGGAFALDLPGGGFINLCPLDSRACGLKNPPTLGEIDHFGLGIENFQEGETTRQLKARGLNPVDAGDSAFIKDPNGTLVQVSAPAEPLKK